MKKGIVLTLSLVLAFSTMALAQAGMGMGGGNGQCGGGPGPGRGDHCTFGQPGARVGMGNPDRPNRFAIPMLITHAEELGLTDEQVDKLQDLHTNFQMEQIDRRAALQKAMLTMKDAMGDDQAREADVMQAIDQVSRLKADMLKMRYAHRQAVKEVLTSEQLDKMDQLRRDRMMQNMKDGGCFHKGSRQGQGQNQGIGCKRL